MATPQPQAAVPKKVEPGTAAETVPLDTQTPLAPTHALSITHTKHHTILIQDLTPFLSSLFSPSTGLAIEEATKLIDGTPAPPTLYTLKKENLLGSHMTVHDKEGKEVAEWKNPILSLHAGKVTIKFLDGEAGQKTVEVNSIGHDRISESFDLNKKTYVWEAESKHHQHKHLYEISETMPTPAGATEGSTSTPETQTTAKPITKRAREVARYSQKHVHGHGHAGGKEGLLVIDSGEISDLVGVLTLCAMLEQVHKEERFDTTFEKVVGVVG
jgi:hypothetical protein